MKKKTVRQQIIQDTFEHYEQIRDDEAELVFDEELGIREWVDPELLNQIFGYYAEEKEEAE